MLISWRQGVSGDFATASNWNPAAVPGPVDDVTIGAKGTYTVTSSVNETVDALSILDKHATLFVTGASNFATTNGVNDGTIVVDSGSSLSISNPLPHRRVRLRTPARWRQRIPTISQSGAP